jgi:hypothetical protein
MKIEKIISLVTIQSCLFRKKKCLHIATCRSRTCQAFPSTQFSPLLSPLSFLLPIAIVWGLYNPCTDCLLLGIKMQSWKFILRSSRNLCHGRLIFSVACCLCNLRVLDELWTYMWWYALEAITIFIIFSVIYYPVFWMLLILTGKYGSIFMFVMLISYLTDPGHKPYEEHIWTVSLIMI